MKKDKIESEFDESYTLAKGVKEIIESGSTDEEIFAEILAKNSFTEEFLEKITSEEEFEKEHERLEKAFQENDSDLFVKKLKKMEAAKRLKRTLIIASSAAASIIAFTILLFIGEEKSENYPNLLSEGITIPTIFFEDSTKMEMKGNEKYVTEQTTNQTTESTPNNERRLVVPAGYTFTIVLNDGTEVTLNAGSELAYPNTFSGSSRNVRLKGEGYFKVTKSEKPFIVNVDQSYVKVYGTEFNINAMNSGTVKTVLVEGSVGVGFDGEKNEVMLRPNEMAITNLVAHNSTVTAADVETTLAWLNGYFMYDENSLEEMLCEMAAWYDVEFVFDDTNLKKIAMVGSFKRSNTLKELLTMIEETTNVKFIKEGGKLYKVEKDK